MAKAEWGLKRICPHCGARYYDMKKNPPVCPSCGTVFDTDTVSKARRSRASAEDKPRKPAPEVLDDLPVVETDGEGSSLIEDADELEDDVDVEDVVEVSTDDDERN